MTTQNKNGNGAAGTNGKASSESIQTLAVATIKPGETPLPSVPGVQLPKKEVTGMPPVEDRIHKVNQLFALVEKHETLLETRKKLKSFKLSTDGSRDSLRIIDSKGSEFQTTNSGCIADVLEVLKVSIDQKITEVEAQIKF